MPGKLKPSVSRERAGQSGAWTTPSPGTWPPNWFSSFSLSGRSVLGPSSSSLLRLWSRFPCSRWSTISNTTAWRDVSWKQARYERVSPLHSWNSSHRMTNYFLFNLQRHSDHHASPGRRYQTLRHFNESPQLPNGYAGMVLLALVPPLWRRVMDPKVEAFRERSGANP